MYEEILERLIKARKQAGLSQSQAAKLLNYSAPSSLSDIELGKNPLSLRLFLNMCELYDISEVWAITGVNPKFDREKVRLAMQKSRTSLEDIEHMLDLFESLKQS